MQNPLRGRTEFVVQGKRYDVEFNWNSAVEYEEVAGHAISEAVADILGGKLSAKRLRAMLWAGLRQHHPDMALRDVGQCIDALGRREAQRVLGVGVRYYYPELTAPAEDAAAPGGDADPQTPPPST
jgi:hypothetical protein